MVTDATPQHMLASLDHPGSGAGMQASQGSQPMPMKGGRVVSGSHPMWDPTKGWVVGSEVPEDVTIPGVRQAQGLLLVSQIAVHYGCLCPTWCIIIFFRVHLVMLASTFIKGKVVLNSKCLCLRLHFWKHLVNLAESSHFWNVQCQSEVQWIFRKTIQAFSFKRTFLYLVDFTSSFFSECTCICQVQALAQTVFNPKF